MYIFLPSSTLNIILTFPGQSILRPVILCRSWFGDIFPPLHVKSYFSLVHIGVRCRMHRDLYSKAVPFFFRSLLYHFFFFLVPHGLPCVLFYFLKVFLLGPFLIMFYSSALKSISGSYEPHRIAISFPPPKKYPFPLRSLNSSCISCSRQRVQNLSLTLVSLKSTPPPFLRAFH